MDKRIGLLGGISYESTKQYYELIHRRYFEITRLLFPRSCRVQPEFPEIHRL